MVDIKAPTYNTLKTMAKNQVAERGITPAGRPLLYQPSAEVDGAEFGVLGAVGSAIETFALNSLARSQAQEQNQEYVGAVARQTEVLTQHSQSVGNIIAPLAIKHASDPDKFMNSVMTAKQNYFADVPAEQHNAVGGVWGAISYPYFGKIQKNAVVAQKARQKQGLETATTHFYNALLASASVGDTNAMTAQLQIFQSANNAMVVGGYKTAEDGVADEISLLGSASIAKYVADGDWAGATTHIDALRKNNKQSFLASPAQQYLDDQLADLDKRNRHNNNLADYFADSQTDDYRKRLGENANKTGWTYAIGMENLYARQGTMNPDVFSASLLALEKFNPVIIMQEPIVRTTFSSVKSRLLDASNNMLNMGGGDAVIQEVASRLFQARIGGVSISSRADSMFVTALGDKVVAQVSALGDLSAVKDLSFTGIDQVITTKKANYIKQSQQFWTDNGNAGLKSGWAKQIQGKWVVVDDSNMPATVGSAWKNVVTGKESIVNAVKSLTTLQKLLYASPPQTQKIGGENAK